MRAGILISSLLLIVGIAIAQTPVKVSVVFGSEPQNRMAAQIPSLLLEAYRMGAISAYYPMSPDRKIPYEQFLQHFGAAAKAQEILAKPPAWFCGERTNPKLNLERLECLSKRFEIIERMVRNSISQLNEWKQTYVRLIYDDTCDPRGFETFGPVFKIHELSRLAQEEYQLVNPRNQVVTYSIYDVLKLRLFAARVKRS